MQHGAIAQERTAARKGEIPTFRYVHQQIEAVGALDPDGCALRHGRLSLSHAELTKRAKRVAGDILARGIEPGSVIAVRLDRSFEQIIAMLGILHAGCAFMSIDPADPAARANSLIDACAAAAVITDAARASDHAGMIVITDDLDAANDTAIPPALPAVCGSDLAYIIHTSGSTGAPNGVEITHASLAHLIRWTNDAFAITRNDRTSHAHGLGFDAVIWELWPALAAGATIHIIDDVVRTSPDLLRQALLAERITIAFVPTVLAEPLIAADWPIDAPLRWLLTGGDVLRAYPRKPLPFALVNNYGPAECTVQTTWAIVPMRPGDAIDAELPTIGRPISGVLVHILDERQQPVVQGAEGEIWIGGKSVGRGYRNRPLLTASKFWPDPFSPEPGARMYRTGDRARWRADGDIAFCGRADRQVKIGGVRIELDEIALALQRHPEVGSAVVVARDGDAADTFLTAYVVPKSSPSDNASPAGRPTPLDLRQFLYRCLPRSYIPRFFVILEAMPLTRNGKVDYAALPPATASPSPARQDDPAALSPLETSVLGLIHKSLPVEDVALTDNFFLLGGHSLIATQVVVQCRDLFGVQVMLRDLFEADTIAAFVAAIEARLAAHVSNLSDHDVSILLEKHPAL